MRDSKFLCFFDSLSKKEKARFKGFLQSPFFKKSERLVRFLEAITGTRREMETIPEAAWRACFGEKEYNPNHFRKLLGDLNVASLRFLTEIAFERDDPQPSLCLLDELNRRNLTQQLQTHLKSAKSNFKKDDIESGKGLLYTFQVGTRVYSNQIRQVDRKSVVDLSSTSNALDSFFILTRLKIICEERSSLQVTNRPNESNQELQETILKMANLRPFSENVFIRLYFLLVSMFRGGDVSQLFEKITLELERTDKKLDFQELQGFLNLLQNYFIHRFNSDRGNPFYRKAVFEIFALRIKTNTILTDGFITRWDFKNMVSLAILLDKIPLAERWSHSLIDKVDQRYRANVKSFSQAHLLFAKKEYSQSIKPLQMVEFEDEYYALDVKNLMYKCYWEQGDFLALVSHLETFRRWLQRQKSLPETRKEAHLNRIKFSLKTVRQISRPELSRNDIEALKSELEANSNIHDKEYLSEKLEEAISRSKN